MMRIRQVPSLLCEDCGSDIHLIFAVLDGDLGRPDLNNVRVKHYCLKTNKDTDVIVPVARFTTGSIELP